MSSFQICVNLACIGLFHSVTVEGLKIEWYYVEPYLLFETFTVKKLSKVPASCGFITCRILLTLRENNLYKMANL